MSTVTVKFNPKTHAVVSIEPTALMIGKGCLAFVRADGGTTISLAAAWRAMVRAASVQTKPLQTEGVK